MPNFDQALFTTCYNQIVFSVKNGIEYLAVSLHIAFCGMAEHGLQVGEWANGFETLVFLSEAILQDFASLKLIKVRTLDRMNPYSFLHHSLKPFFPWIGTGASNWHNLVLFLWFVFD